MNDNLKLECIEIAKKFIIDENVIINFESDDWIIPFRNNMEFTCISCMDYNLSKEFIREFMGLFHHVYILYYHNFSENDIREFQQHLCFQAVSKKQKLSESFIREFKDKLNWKLICYYQKLSVQFLKEMKDYISWSHIAYYQKLNESFIEEFKDKLNMDTIKENQKLSQEFIKKHNLTINPDNWLYWTNNQKVKVIEKYYKIESDKKGRYIIAYKNIRKDRFSVYNFQYQYLKDKTYSCHCDHTSCECSYGLSAWTEEKALAYNSHGILIKVKIYVKDIGRIVESEDAKIRCSKFKVLT